MGYVTFEISAHRIGGDDHVLARTFPPRIETMPIERGSTLYVQLPGLAPGASSLLRVSLYGWVPVRGDLLSAEARIDLDQYTVCRGRPVLLSTLPCDVPLYSSHMAVTHPELGVISLGLRCPAPMWTPELLSLAEPDE